MEEVDPRKHDVRDVDWESLWMVLLPYIAKDLGTDDRLDDLDPYLIRAVETDQNQECMQYLLFFAIHTFCQNLSESGWSDDGATKYVIELLYKIYCGEEPNKVFKWEKPTQGPRPKSKHEPLLNVAIPELLRKNRKRELKDRLKEPELSRRERAKLMEEYLDVKFPSHPKKSFSSKTGNTDDYSATRVRQIMEEHGPTAQAIVGAEKQLEARLQKATEDLENLQKWRKKRQESETS